MNKFDTSLTPQLITAGSSKSVFEHLVFGDELSIRSSMTCSMIILYNYAHVSFFHMLYLILALARLCRGFI